jgi:hypothetical protein
MKFEQEHTLPMLAVHATWVAVQQRQEKRMLSIEKLMGKEEVGSSGPMTKAGMLGQVGMLPGAKKFEKQLSNDNLEDKTYDEKLAWILSKMAISQEGSET